MSNEAFWVNLEIESALERAFERIDRINTGLTDAEISLMLQENWGDGISAAWDEYVSPGEEN